MTWLVRRGPGHVVHRAVQEGGGRMVLMMTSCGLSIRWDQPHSPWERARGEEVHITCRRCSYGT